jgi:hypothetical protein
MTAVGWLQIFFNVNSNDELAFHAIVLQALSNQNLIQVSLKILCASRLLHVLCVVQGTHSYSCLSFEQACVMRAPIQEKSLVFMLASIC